MVHRSRKCDFGGKEQECQIFSREMVYEEEGEHARVSVVLIPHVLLLLGIPVSGGPVRKN